MSVFRPRKSVLDYDRNAVVSLNGTRLEEPIRRYCLAFDAILIALKAFNGLSTPADVIRGTIQNGKAVNLGLILPHPRTLYSAILEEDYTPVEIAFREVPLTRPSVVPYSIKRCASVVSDAAVVQFILYYEANIKSVRKVFGSNVKDLEPIWAFARVIRNAAAHGGAINIGDANFQPVSWYGLKYGPMDTGRQVVDVDVFSTDIIFLMLEMEAVLLELGL